MGLRSASQNQKRIRERKHKMTSKSLLSRLWKGIAALAFTVSILGSSQSAMAQVGTTLQYVQTSSAVSTTSANMLPIPGLQMPLPSASSGAQSVLVIADLPNLYLDPASGQISGDSSALPGNGRKPITVVVRVPLTGNTQNLAVQWGSARNTLVHNDTFASLSAIFTTP
jgi:hypothetical protein